MKVVCISVHRRFVVVIVNGDVIVVIIVNGDVIVIVIVDVISMVITDYDGDDDMINYFWQ